MTAYRLAKISIILMAGFVVGCEYVPGFVPRDYKGFLNYPSVVEDSDTNPNNIKTNATSYYNSVDPDSLKGTLANWKHVNGFDGGDDAITFYNNMGELGFGRAMHMKKTGSNVAFYVSNYRNADDAINNTDIIATVAMDLSPVNPGDPPIVKFYVFNDKGIRVNSADLDFRGQKGVPQLCMVCHGGDKVYQGNKDVHAKFIPFDLDALTCSNQRPCRSQEGEFKKMNQAIVQSPSTDAGTALICGWYGGCSFFGALLPGTTQNSSFVPKGWSGHEDLYLGVVKPYCRSCHINRVNPDGTDSNLTWASYDQFNNAARSIQARVCSTRDMPQANVTYINFWTSSGPEILEQSGLQYWDHSQKCRPGPQPQKQPTDKPIGDHFYTTSYNEWDTSIKQDHYSNESWCCYVFDQLAPYTTPLYRLYNPQSVDHFYTTNFMERNNALDYGGYQDEGICCYVFFDNMFKPSDTQPLFRLVNPTTFDHLYTLSSFERDDKIRSFGYLDERVCCHVFDSQKSLPPPYRSTPLYRSFLSKP